MSRFHRFARPLFAALTFAALAIAAGVANGKDLKVPSAKYPEIQTAVDAAAPGDVVRVAKGVYLETVVIETADLRLVGKDAVLDAGYLGACVSVRAPRVTIEGFTLVNGARGIEVTAPEAVLQQNEFRCCHDAGAWVLADDCAILDSEFLHQTSESILVGSSAAGTTRVEGNRFEESAYVRIAGGRAIVRKNDFVRTFGALWLTHDHPTAESRIEKNDLRHVAGEAALAVEVEAAGGVRVAHNRILTAAGIVFARADSGPLAIEHNDFREIAWVQVSSGQDASIQVSVEENEFRRCKSDALRVFAAGAVVRGNEITQAAGTGILVDGAGARIESNEVSGSGGAGILAFGAEAVVRGNEVRGSAADGIIVSGDFARVEDNASLMNQGDGVTVLDGAGATIRDNVCLGNDHEGIDNSGTDTVIAGNRCLGSALGVGPDIAGTGGDAKGTVATFEDNEFETGGADAPQRLTFLVTKPI